jgi:aminopeptidase N
MALDVAVDLEKRTIEGTVEHRIRVVADGVDAFELDAVALEILDVRMDGEKTRHSHDGERVVIRPAKAPARGAELTLSVRYRGAPVRGLWFVAPDAHRTDKPLQAWTQGQDEDARFWFPCWDHPHQKAPSEVRATVPADCFALSNGALVARDEKGGKATYRWRQKAPHPTYLVTLVVGRFDTVTDRAGDVPLAYHVPVGRKDDARRTFGRTPEMIALFGRLFGAAYPFEKYDQIVVSDFIFGGMENTSATTLYEWAMLTPEVADATDTEWLIAHELGHQWFGDLLTCRDWPHAWLNEGFATYCESLWYEFGHDQDRGRRHLLDTLRNYFDEARDAYRRPIVCDRYDAPTDLFDRHLYEKGACVLHHLRGELGDDAFFRSLARYVRAHREGSVETVDLRRAIEAETGRNLDGFFAQWVESPGHPEFHVRHAWDPLGKRLTLTVRQTQNRGDGTPVFSARVKCVAWLADGKSEERAFDVTGAEHRFHWELPDDPVGVRFASDGAPLFAIDFERPETFLTTQLERDQDPLGRVEAAEALAASATPSAVEALARAFAAEKRWTHKVELAQALGGARLPAARDALAAALADAHPRVRAAAAAALGRFREPEAAAAGVARLGRERHPLVRAQLVRSLGRTREDAGLPAVRAAVGEHGTWNELVRRCALEGLGAARRREDESLLRAELAPDRPELVRAAAARALAEIYADLDDKTAVRETLEKLLPQGFHVARAAMGALRTLGDPRAAGALEKLAAERFLDGRLKRLARLTARALRDGSAARDKAAALRERIDKSEGEMKKLVERVEALERKRAGPASASRAASRRRNTTTRRRPRRGGRS